MTEAEVKLSETISHAELQTLVEHECRRLDHWYYAPADSIRSQAGWVDLVILGKRASLFAELKTEAGRRTMAQIRVAERLQLCGLRYRLWRPADWLSGAIQGELEQL